MNRPSDPRASVAPTADHEIKLRLGDILPRIPKRFLKPGDLDAKQELRFKIEDLSNDIARGRASVPLSEIAKLCPEIFHGGIDLADGIEVQLPLQKLFEQLGGFVPPLKTPSQSSHRVAEKSPVVKQPIAEKDNGHAAPLPVVQQPFPPSENGHQSAPPALESKAKAQKTSDTISLNLCAIFRLLPTSVAGHAEMPDADARINLPLALIEPQLSSGHVEIPLRDFLDALPERLAAGFNRDADCKVWIPLDEIFQNLPSAHLSHLEEHEPVNGSETGLSVSAETSLPAPQMENSGANASTLLARATKIAGVFAAAVFADKDSFASENFPSKIDLAGLHRHLGLVEKQLRELPEPFHCERNFTLACEDFFVTIFITAQGFVCVLHRDRALPDDGLANLAGDW